MKRLLVLLALVLAGTLVYTLGPFASLHGPGVIIVKSTDVAVEQTFSQASPTLGDLTVRQAVLTNNSKPAGTAIIVCQYVGSGHTLGDQGASLCYGTYRFKRGDIEAQGLVVTNSSYLLAVIGGTGFYSAVGGVLSVRSLVGDPLRRSLLFDLVAP